MINDLELIIVLSKITPIYAAMNRLLKAILLRHSSERISSQGIRRVSNSSPSEKQLHAMLLVPKKKKGK